MKTAAAVFAIAVSLASTLPAHAEINDGLIAFWPFDECAFTDMSGNGNDGTPIGAPECIEGRQGPPDSAYRLNGVNDAIDIGNGVKPPLPLSITAYVRPEALPDGRVAGIFRNDEVNSGGSRWGVLLYATADGFGATIYNGFASSSTKRGVFTKGRPPVIGQWQMVTAVIKSIDEFEIYWNGVAQDLYLDGGTASSMIYSSGNGALGDGDKKLSEENRRFEGAIDDIRVYERALSRDEINVLLDGVPFPLCDLMLTADTYALNDIIEPSTLRIGNLGVDDLCFDLKIWLFNQSTTEARSLLNRGNLCWGPNSQVDVANAPIFAIPASDLGAGTHEYNCRILDVTTGAELIFDQNVFNVVEE